MKLFRKRVSLRQACIDEYGEEFGTMYDSVNSGIPIGGFSETIAFVEMVEKVKKNLLDQWLKFK